MKIAMMVRGYLLAPRPNDMVYAPLDLAVAAAEELANRDHDVTFFAPLGSKLKKGVKVESCNLRALVKDLASFNKLFHDAEKVNQYLPALWDRYFVDEMFARAKQGEFDVLHFHHAEAALDAARQNPNVPVVYTLNDPIYDWHKELAELFSSPNQHFISISRNQRRDAPDLPYIATAYNGVAVAEWPFSATAEDYLLCVGRIVPEKGIKEAIQIARETGYRLLIVGPTSEGRSQDYFDQYIKPQLDDQILYLGFVERQQLARYYQKAKALLTPIQWEEPFGMTTIEAMACGTPVISLNRGAAPEIIKHGKTGFVVGSVAEMVDSVLKLDHIDRAACREHVKQHFSVVNMVNTYEAAYKKALREQTNKQKIVRDLNLLLVRLLHLRQRLQYNLHPGRSQKAFAPFSLEEEALPLPVKPTSRASNK
jgi:glycosyltransferase involved in cell wall biosynthesis